MFSGYCPSLSTGNTSGSNNIFIGCESIGDGASCSNQIVLRAGSNTLKVSSTGVFTLNGTTVGSGSAGYAGSRGYTGSQGDIGASGYTGSKGDPGGYTGSQGTTGYTGSKGDAGGYTGSQGTTGYTGSAGTGASARSTSSVTSSSLTDGNSENLTITGFKGYALLKIQTSAAAWVRIYTDTTSRSNDSSRSELTDPSPGSGVIAEVITTGNQTILISPAVLGFNNENPIVTNIPITVKNKSGGTTAITITLTIIQLEI